MKFRRETPFLEGTPDLSRQFRIYSHLTLKDESHETPERPRQHKGKRSWPFSALEVDQPGQVIREMETYPNWGICPTFSDFNPQVALASNSETTCLCFLNPRIKSTLHHSSLLNGAARQSKRCHMTPDLMSLHHWPLHQWLNGTY